MPRTKKGKTRKHKNAWFQQQEKARTTAAVSTLANVVKECAVKYANAEANPTRPSVTPDGYSAVTAGGSTTGCTQTDTIVATSGDTANYATFTYNTATGAKTCTPNNSTGCNNGAW